MSQQTEHYKRVREFMDGAGQATPDKPTVPSREVRELRARLILEEALEAVSALGFILRVVSTEVEEIHLTDKGHFGRISFYESSKAEPDLPAIIDGCCDLSVVTRGTLVACGVPDKPFLEAVDANNMEKIATGHVNPETGKFEKSADHAPPEIAGILASLTE